MFRILVHALLVSLVAHRSNKGVLNDLLDRLPAVPDDEKIKERWFTQRLDHMTPMDTRVWKQRYFANMKYYKRGGPIFLLIGGEGSISAEYVRGKYMNLEWAEKFHGGTVAIEHRFYGKSVPLGDLALENLRYLTSRQALADLDFFQRNSGLQYKNTKWVCIGGSYSGNLAAWYKLKYPKNTVGCFAFSAPIQAKVDFFEYGQMVYEAMAHQDTAGAQKLMDVYNTFRSILTEGTFAARKDLYDKLRMCPFSVLAEEDRDFSESVVNTRIAEIVQYNNTGKTHIEDLQRFVDESRLSPVDLAIAIYTKLQPEREKESPEECAFFSLRETYKDIAVTEPEAENPMAAMRGWWWQSCNEFGYFCTSRQALNRTTLYTRGNTNPALGVGICTEIFQFTPEQVDANVALTNAYYGGFDASVSSTVFINGEFDPWSKLSHLRKGSEWWDSEVYIIPNGSHCIGLYKLDADSHPPATAVQEKLLMKLHQWIDYPQQHIV